MDLFRNPVFEYETLELSPETRGQGNPVVAEMREKGWQRVWADVTMTGTFIVFRRERLAEEGEPVDLLKLVR
jgi:hypothetical protein